ncbi:MAG: hypothetical protein ACYTJ0_09015 [Planctomycetota bacterium]
MFDSLNNVVIRDVAVVPPARVERQAGPPAARLSGDERWTTGDAAPG